MYARCIHTSTRASILHLTLVGWVGFLLLLPQHSFQETVGYLNENLLVTVTAPLERQIPPFLKSFKGTALYAVNGHR